MGESSSGNGCIEAAEGGCGRARRKLLFVIWSNSAGGGAERILSYLVNELAERGGYDIDLLEVTHFDKAWEKMPESVRVLPPVIDETATSFRGRVRRGVRRRLRNWAPGILRRIIRDDAPYDVAIAFNNETPMLFLKPDEASIGWTHSTVENLLDNPVAMSRQRRTYDDVTEIVAIAERTRESIVEFFPECSDKIEVIYNGFPLERIRSLSEADLGIELAKPAILAVGGLEERKNPLGILEGFKTVLPLVPDAHLYYVGSGEMESELKEAVARAGLQDRVHLLGHHANPYPLIKQASCIVSLSTNEGFQSVFVEGNTFGVPFISSSAGAAVEMSGGGERGIVVESAAEVGKAYVELMERSSRPGFKEDLEAYAESLSVQRMADRFEDLVERILARGRLSGEC